MNKKEEEENSKSKNIKKEKQKTAGAKTGNKTDRKRYRNKGGRREGKCGVEVNNNGETWIEINTSTHRHINPALEALYRPHRPLAKTADQTTDNTIEQTVDRPSSTHSPFVLPSLLFASSLLRGRRRCLDVVGQPGQALEQTLARRGATWHHVPDLVLELGQLQRLGDFLRLH